jgi:hypothetical protein
MRQEKRMPGFLEFKAGHTYWEGRKFAENFNPLF